MHRLAWVIRVALFLIEHPVIAMCISAMVFIIALLSLVLSMGAFLEL
jgi:hypothetical protein